MKKINVSSLICTGTFLLATSTGARAESEIVEVGVARAFITAQGFDDNDTVEVIVDGELPNSCYSLERQTTEIDADKKEVRIHQFAVRQTDGLCDKELAQDTPQLMTPVPFTDTVALGRLSAGDYQMIHYPVVGEEKRRAFNVAIAPTSTVDSRPYASVTQVSTADLVVLGSDASIVVDGILNNSCYSFNEEVKVSIVDDVVIVMPVVKIDAAGACLQYVRPFSKTINLGKLTSKRYLVHVRSMHGKSVNRVFSVMPKEMR